MPSTRNLEPTSSLACQANWGGNSTPKSPSDPTNSLYVATKYSFTQGEAARSSCINHGYFWSWRYTQKRRLGSRWAFRNEDFASASGTTHEKAGSSQQACFESYKLVHVYYGGSSSHAKESDIPPRLPQLNPGSIAQPYITSTGGVARADRTRLVNDKDRQITARRIVKVKEGTKEVGELSCLPLFRLGRKIYFEFSWRRIIGPVLGTRSALLRVIS